jgi:cell volume regulation protein A
VDYSNQIILFGAALIFISIIASVVSSHLGAPLLLVFLVVGMLAGEDGPGGIHFDDFQLANLLGSLALAIILFDGGMRTRISSFRVGLWPALSLATLGVLITTLVAGLFASWVLDLHWLQGLLIGAIVGSTDAAAVFSLLHAAGLELKQRVSSTLEIESGSNDPMAVFLTVVLVEMLAAGETDLSWILLGKFVMQMGIGGLAGVVGGRLLVWLINRLTLKTALYPLLAMAGGVLIYAATSLTGGSGFLAIYLAGLELGNRRTQAEQNILRVHDGLAWLSQIGMFLMLGLLVTPTALIPIALDALAISAVLIFLARPLAVWLSLLPFRLPGREQLFISWVGLRGAVPVILGTFPLLAGLQQAQVYFNVAFFVVLVSLLLQGWTVALAARISKLQVPPPLEPVQRLDLDMPGQFNYELLGYNLEPGSIALNFPVNRMPLPEQTQVAAVIRGGALLNAQDIDQFRAGDYIYLLTSPQSGTLLSKLFAAPHAPDWLEEQQFFGELVLNEGAKMGELSLLYDFTIDEGDKEETVSGFLGKAFKGRAVVGDRLHLGSIELVVKEMERDRITKVGLNLHAGFSSDRPAQKD